MTPKAAALQVIRDVIESASGDAVDVAAWDFDQLVRILRHPHELIALLRGFDPPSDAYHTEFGVAARIARARVIGEASFKAQIEAATSRLIFHRDHAIDSPREDQRESHRARMQEMQALLNALQAASSNTEDRSGSA